MKKEDLIKEWVTRGLENKESKKEVVDGVCRILFALNNIPTEKKLTSEQLDQIAGGATYTRIVT